MMDEEIIKRYTDLLWVRYSKGLIDHDQLGDLLRKLSEWEINYKQMQNRGLLSQNSTL